MAFRPRKKYLPPPLSPQTFLQSPSPSRAASSETPPPPHPSIFIKKPDPPASSSDASSLSEGPGTEKNKTYQTTTIPSQQPWNNESETQPSLPQEHEILRHFMAVVVSSAFRNSLKDDFRYVMISNIDYGVIT